MDQEMPFAVAIGVAASLQGKSEAATRNDLRRGLLSPAEPNAGVVRIPLSDLAELRGRPVTVEELGLALVRVEMANEKRRARRLGVSP